MPMLIDYVCILIMTIRSISSHISLPFSFNISAFVGIISKIQSWAGADFAPESARTGP